MKAKLKYIILSVTVLFFACSEDTIEENGIGTLNGTVVESETNEPLSNVKIVTNPSSSTVFTDSEGKFVIETIQTGEYSVQAEYDDYVDAFEAVTILNGKSSSVVFELKKGKTANLPPTVPILLTPTDGATNLEPSVDFIWSSASNDTDVITYNLELRNGSTGEIENIETTGDTIATITNLRLGTNYFWQITASDGENEKVQSEISQFTTSSTPQNDFLFVRSVNGNSVIFSGADDDSTSEEDEINFREFQLTSASFNSFRPHRNIETSKIAFLRTVNGATQLHTMNLDGTGVRQITSAVPLNGFRITELNYTWAQNGGKIYYPSFDKLYSINPDGGGLTQIYQTPDGSFISEVSAASLDDNLIALKTNNSSGYEVRVFTVRLSSGSQEEVVYENTPGAVSGIDLDANGARLVYSKDISGSENSQYRQFNNRIYIYNLNTNTETLLDYGAQEGSNDIQPAWSPSEGEILFTRKPSNLNSEPEIFVASLNNLIAEDLLFTNAYMPDWE